MAETNKIPGHPNLTHTHDENCNHSKGGRPTKYSLEHCEKLISMFKEGKTIAEFCSQSDISIECFYEWKRVHPEFSDAYLKAAPKATEFRTKFLRDNLLNTKANAALIKFYMVNCDGWKTDKTEAKTEVKSQVEVAVKEIEEVKKIRESLKKDM